MEKTTKRILSGVQPSGDLHLGNYLGAIKNFVTLQKEYECFFCVVDLHAITVWQDPKVLANKTREVTAAFIASGIDPKKNNIFVQSQVPQHAQLGWLFNCVARMGLFFTNISGNSVLLNSSLLLLMIFLAIIIYFGLVIMLKVLSVNQLREYLKK